MQNEFSSLQGDLNHMYAQMDFLRRELYDVKIEDGIPLVKSEDYENAVRDIYERNIIGWWNYKDFLLSKGICTEEEYFKKLRRRVNGN